MSLIDRQLGRRNLLAGALALGAGATVGAAAAAPIPNDFERIALWPGTPPGGEGVAVGEAATLRDPAGPAWNVDVSHIMRPSLTILRPARSNGSALLLIPGGGYSRIAVGHEGFPVARLFAVAGYACYILLYRMPADGWAAGPDAPLQDAQRAVRLMRQRARADGFDPSKIGVIGFSAGGHLAARLSSSAAALYDAVDAADALSFRPAVAGLLYPVILTEGAAAHLRSRNELIGPAPEAARIAAMAANASVGLQTPPTFLAHALDDKGVPAENSLAMLASLRAAGVKAELHLFERAGHGFGVTLPKDAPVPWPDLFLAFARRHGLGTRDFGVPARGSE